ncbi:MAG: hemerythrin domain-containing protein [Bacteroidota bacterium]
MNPLTQPLHDEHRELFPHVDRILQVAGTVANGKVADLRSGLEEVYTFLAHHLLAHAQAEEAALYPVVQDAMGSPDATRTMSRDHVEVRQYVEELGRLKDGLPADSLTAVDADNLQRVLYGLYALLKLHFAKEEEVCLPILDRYLTAEAARRMFEKMEAAAARAKETLAA